MVVSGFLIFAAGCSSTSNQKTNVLGYGYEIIPISTRIYRIKAMSGSSNDVMETRNTVMLRAAELAQEKGYERFQIIGGEGFEKVSRKFQAGPIPIPLPSEPRGSLVVKLLEKSDPNDADTFFAANVLAELSAAAPAKK